VYTTRAGISIEVYVKLSKHKDIIQQQQQRQQQVSEIQQCCNEVA